MKKNKKINWKIIVAVLVIIAIIIVGIIIYKNNQKVKYENQEGKIEQGKQNEIIQQNTIGQIDMNNTENAKIENGMKQNISKDILKDRNLDGISITEIQLNAKEGLSHFTATVQNNRAKDFVGGVAKITFTNQDGSTYAELEVFIPEMKKGTKNAIDAATTADIVNAYDFSIVLKNN